MSDQADGLRQLVRARGRPLNAAEHPRRGQPRSETAPARSFVLTSGKGGVGTSNIALNLAIALGEYGQRVVLIDADLGLANIDLLCGLTPPCDLGDVLAGERPLREAIITGPGEVRVVPGAHGMRTLFEVLGEGPERLVAELKELETEADFLLTDAGSGLSPAILTLAAAADQVLLVTTPEPTSVADAHATIQRFRRMPSVPVVRTMVNQAHSASEAEDVLTRLTASAREFLGMVVTPLGHVRADPHVPIAVRGRQPFVVAHPSSIASRGVRRLARTLIEERQPRPGRRPGFFAALSARWALSQVAR